MWDEDALSSGKTTFKTCFDGSNYFHVAAIRTEFKYISNTTPSVGHFISPSASSIKAIGCAGTKFYIYYTTPTETLHQLIVDTASGSIEARLFEPSFSLLKIASYPQDFLLAITTTSNACNLYPGNGSTIINGPDIGAPSLCIPISSLSTSTFYYGTLDPTSLSYLESPPGEPVTFNFSTLSLLSSPESYTYLGDFYVTALSSGSFVQFYANQDVPVNMGGVAYRTSLIFETDLASPFNGALVTVMVPFGGGGSLTVLATKKNTTVIQASIYGVIGVSESSLITVAQLDPDKILVNILNGTILNSVIISLVGDPPQAPITNAPSTTPTVFFPPSDSQIPNTVTIAVNSSVAVDELNLNATTVLVVSNEAVITVTNCASLAGTLQYVLSQPQYETLIANNTLNIPVLLTECTNGSFDSIQVTWSDPDDCVTFTAEPNKTPSQLTLLVTTLQSIDCDQIIGEPDVLSTGAIIGIAVGCAVAVVLIILLALYVSPVRKKVFPYGKR